MKTDGTSGMLAVNYTSLFPVMVKAIQEQQALIGRQEDRIAALEAERSRPGVASLSSMLGGGTMLALLPLALFARSRRKQQQS